MPKLLICLLACLAVTMPGYAAVIDVEAENVQKREDRIEAYGNVFITGEDIKLKAGYVVYDSVTEDLWAVGDVRLEEKGGEINAEALYYNLRRKDFRLENGSVFIYAQPAIISGDSLTRYGLDQYEGQGIEFTPCLSDPPAWSIAAGSLEVPLERYGQATNARFQIRDFPVVYFPYFLFPVKVQRQSGLLLPVYGNSTDYGTRVGLPYYRVLGRSADATITPNYLSDRGLLVAGEYRYRLDAEQYGEVYVESLVNDARGGEVEEGTILGTIPDSRWLFRSFQTGGNLTWDVRLVSNPDYFRDIGSMYTNPDVWEDTLTLGQGRSLEELVSRGQWLNSARGFSANVSGIWTQDLTVDSNERTLQELPRVTLRMNQRNIPGTQAFVSSTWNTSYVYSRDWIEEVKDTGQVQLFLPFNWFPFLTVTPSYTQYYRDAHITSNPGGFQSDAVRSLWQARSPALTAYYNDSQFFQDNPGLFEDDTYVEIWGRRDITFTTALYSRRFLDGMYHQVVPTAEWTYFSRQNGNYDPSDPDDLFPALFPEDVWEKENKVTLGLNNYIRTRSGRALVEFSLSRIYDYLLDSWDYYEANIVIAPVSWFSLRHLNRFDSPDHRNATIEHWTRLSLRDGRGDELYMSEEYNREDTTTARLGAIVNLVLGFSARTEVSYDFLDNRYINTKQGLTYTSQCWNVELFREVDTSDETIPRDTTIGVTVNLLGLGQVIKTRRSVSGQGE